MIMAAKNSFPSHSKRVKNVLHCLHDFFVRNCQNGAVLVRCGQPEIGWLGWRNTDDEKFLEAIPLACAMNPGTRKHSSDDDDRSSRSSLNDEGI